MGLFNLFSHKKRKDTEYNEAIAVETEKKKEARHSIKHGTPADRLDYIKANCETMIDSGRQIEEAKVEYQAVTSYLTDMQKIEMIPQEQRKNLDEAAGKILSLTKERGKLQKKSNILTDKQYHLLEQYEQEIPKELTTLKESEQLQTAIEQDMKHLKKARRKLDIEQEDIISKQAFLKGIAVVICIIVVFLFTLFALLARNSYTNYTIPFIMTVMMAMVAVFYIFTEARKNLVDIQLVQAKQNRQIMLMNKVKIKSVNNLSLLEYAYSKYMIENCEQLQTLWDEYQRMKDEERKYQKNTDSIELNNIELVEQLNRFDIKDPDIWIFQPSAILDSKEMADLRHRLNIRRQKVRERIDLNIRQKEQSVAEIVKTMKSNPDCRDEAEKLLRHYQIDVDE